MVLIQTFLKRNSSRFLVSVLNLDKTLGSIADLTRFRLLFVIDVMKENIAVRENRLGIPYLLSLIQTLILLTSISLFLQMMTQQNL